ncbi:MAG: CBS domain-containing protein [Myxococcota bacterium]|jgi:CBS domain-containing protein
MVPREFHVGTLVLVDSEDSGQLVPRGILTDRDIVIGVVAESGDGLDELIVQDVVARPLVCIHEDAEVDIAITTMTEAGIRRIVVTDADGVLTGILAVDDIIEIMADQLDALTRLMGRAAAAPSAPPISAWQDWM